MEFGSPHQVNGDIKHENNGDQHDHGDTPPQADVDEILRRKRKAREYKACYPCRQRKVKCDQAVPCKTCIGKSYLLVSLLAPCVPQTSLFLRLLIIHIRLWTSSLKGVAQLNGISAKASRQKWAETMAIPTRCYLT